ncbi:MAG: hypothetical protein JXR58_09550 [Bacteroidales bacterium]|nr:hypothetical protein [Bacteroidales bacterium]
MRTKSLLLITVFAFVFATNLLSQETDTINKGVKISGYIQSQYQYFDRVDTLGAVPHHYAKYFGGDFVNDETSQRFMLRRGRLKFTHTTKYSSGVLSFDVTEKSFAVKDFHVKLKENLLESFTFTAGIFSRPFGNEVEFSSSLRESPERSIMIQTIFPGERDLGLKVNFNPKPESALHFLSVDAAIVNGNGAALETDNYKDFIGRTKFSTKKDNKKFFASAGFSFYSGNVKHIYEPVDTLSSGVAKKFYIYSFEEQTNDAGESFMGFLMDSAATVACGTSGGKVKRQYLGFDMQLAVMSPFGKLEIRGEYVSGIQPSSINTNQFDKPTVIYNDMNSASPTGPITGVSWPVHKVPQPYRPVSVGAKEVPHNTLIRKFSGGQLYFVQNLSESGHQIVIKYEWYDPNTEIEGKEITTDYIFGSTSDSLNVTYLSPADVKYTVLGIGWNWKINENVKLGVFYQNVKNEKTGIIKYEGDVNSGWHPHPAMTADIKDDLFTIRIQYNF